MKANQVRDQRILQLRKQGVPRKDVAREFGITPGRIGVIEREAAAAKSQADRRARLQAEMRHADDLDKSWPVVDLLDALWRIVIARKRLLEYFDKIQKTHLTLRELMDLTISATGDAEPGQPNTPLLRIQGIGKYGFHSVVAELTETDLGPRCNKEWRNRLSELKRHLKIAQWPPIPRRHGERQDPALGDLR